VAGIVIGCVIFALILCCICYACARRRGYYAGQTYGTAVPMGGVPMYATTNAYQQPVQAIPVEYAQTAQPYGGPVYAQQPVGGGQSIPQYAASAPPPYSGQSYQVSEPYQQPTKGDAI